MASSHVARLEARLQTLKNEEKTITERTTHAASFIGGAAGGAAYRAWLHKNNKEMPTLMGLDADAAAGAVLLALGFFEVIPRKYADYSVNIGAGLVASTVASKVSGWVDPSMATKGIVGAGEEPRQLGAGSGDVSANRAAEIVAALRASRRAA